MTDLDAVLAAGRGGEDVVAVHGAEDERGAVPRSAAAAAVEARAPPLQAAHAHGEQEVEAALEAHLQAAVLRVLARRQEESAVQQRVAVVHRHLTLAQQAAHARAVRVAQRRQHQRAHLVQTVVLFVVNLTHRKTAPVRLLWTIGKNSKNIILKLFLFKFFNL